MTTKAQYVTSLLNEIGRADLTATAEEWFDDIYQMLNNAADWPYLEVKATRATVADTYSYGLPVDFRSCQLLFLNTGDSNSRKILYMGLAEFVRKYPRVEETVSGYPLNWTRYNNNLVLAPKPSGAWTMNLIYTYNPPAITSGQTPIFTSDFDHIMRSGMRGHGYARIKEYEKSKYNFDLFFKLLQEKGDKQVPEAIKDEMFLRPYGGAQVPSGEYWSDPFVGLRT